MTALLSKSPGASDGSPASEGYVEVNDFLVSGMDVFLDSGILYFMNREIFDVMGGSFDTAGRVLGVAEAIPALADTFDLGAVSDVGSAVGDLLSGISFDID